MQKRLNELDKLQRLQKVHGARIRTSFNPFNHVTHLTLMHDLKFAFRQLLKNPGFTVHPPQCRRSDRVQFTRCCSRKPGHVRQHCYGGRAVAVLTVTLEIGAMWISLIQGVASDVCRTEPMTCGRPRARLRPGPGLESNVSVLDVTTAAWTTAALRTFAGGTRAIAFG